MFCKYCGSPLEDGKTVCPACGKETAESKSGIVITPGKLALSIGAVVLVIALLAAALFGGRLAGQTPSTEPTGATESTEATQAETVPPTVPADTGEDNVTNKGSYTATNDEVIAAMDTVVATMGDAKLTNAELQVYYWLQIQEFLSSEYGYYASYLGLDYTQPMDTQPCMLEEGLTWQQYFLKDALNAWQNYQIMANEAEANEYEMDAEYREYVDGLAQELADNAVSNGFESAEKLLEYNVGVGATVEDYVRFWELYYKGYSYFSHVYDSLMPTDEEAEAYFNEHADVYEDAGLDKTSTTVDVRHVLILPEGATIENIRTETFSEEAWEVGRVTAQNLLDAWVATSASEDSFAAMANENSADTGSNTNGGLYTGVAQGDMVAEFDAWCFDPERKVGDYGLVKTELGYHIMYFSGSSPVWLETARTDLLNERSGKMLSEAAEKYPVEVFYEKMLIGQVDFGN